MNNSTVLSLFIPAITTVAGILMGWLVGRRKSNAEVGILEIQRLEKLITVWQKLAEDIKREYECIKIENKELVAKLESLEKQLDLMKKENEKLLRALKELKKQSNEK